MSSQSNSGVYSEKKIAAYEALFKESSFAKPQEVYLTVTVAHLFGQAYIMEQQGTKEGDPVYSRFVCPLEDITKVYINENAKSSPLFIQCDTDVKGVIHRKRIIVPCLDNVASIVAQIKEVQALHMEKYKAAQEREKERKRRELEEKRLQEQIKKNTDAAIPPLPEVPQLPPENEAVKKPSVTQENNMQARKAEPASAAAKAPDKTPVKLDLSSVEALNNEIAESMKALESFGDSLSKAADKKPEPPVKPIKPILEPTAVPNAAAPQPVPEIPAPSANEEVSPAPVPVREDVKPAPFIPPVEKKAKPVHTEEPARISAPRVNPNGKPSALSDFEAEVRKLKALRDEGKLSAEEYAAQKKQLASLLY